MAAVQNAHGVVLRILEDAVDGQVGGTDDCEGFGVLDVGDVGGERALYLGDRMLPVVLAGGNDHLFAGYQINGNITLHDTEHGLVVGRASQIPACLKSCLSSTLFFADTPRVLRSPSKRIQ